MLQPCARSPKIDPMDSRTTSHRRAVRAVRNAAASGVEAAAAAAGVTPHHVYNQLRQLHPRGECAAAVAKNARRGSDQRRIRALQHRACPPSAVVTAARSQFPKIRLAGRGVASWAARAAAGEHHTRNAQIRALGVLSYTLDRSHPLGRGLAEATLTHGVSGETFADVQRRIPRVAQSPPQALAPLATSKDLTIRSAVGRHLNSPLCVLAALARDTDHRVRRSVARNPSCSLRVLARLARDPSNEVRAAATDHPLFTNILKDFDND